MSNEQELPCASLRAETPRWSQSQRRGRRQDLEKISRQSMCAPEVSGDKPRICQARGFDRFVNVVTAGARFKSPRGRAVAGTLIN